MLMSLCAMFHFEMLMSFVRTFEGPMIVKSHRLSVI